MANLDGVLGTGLPGLGAEHLPGDAMGVGSLISGSYAFSKSSLNIWNFTVHVLLKPGLENFDHYFASVCMDPASEGEGTELRTWGPGGTWGTGNGGVKGGGGG